MRTIKLKTMQEVDAVKLKYYFNAAVSINESAIKVIKKEKIEIPELLMNALKNNQKASENFNNMAYTYQKEYALHIAMAKREATKLQRLEKVIANLEANIKMHEKYKC